MTGRYICLKMFAVSIVFLLGAGHQILPQSQDEARRRCGFDHYYGSDEANRQRSASESAIRAAIAKRRSESTASADGVKRIPIVIHVIHNNGLENISREQIKSQLRVLNEDFRRILGTNGHGDGFDTKIEFCLARFDPEGRPSDGIVRVKSPLTQHRMLERERLSELSYWDSERYLNMYVVRYINRGVAGYSSFPGGPARKDGIVIRYGYFGQRGSLFADYLLGRTATHEAGHWLGLYHTFHNGCGDDPCSSGDFVCDTPPSAAPHPGCKPEINTCSNDWPIDLSDQPQNYMDYSSDRCMNMFTLGQRERMHAVLTSQRRTVWSEENLRACGCDGGSYPDDLPPVADYLAVQRRICAGNSVQFLSRERNRPKEWQWHFPGGEPEHSSDRNPVVRYDRPGRYSVSLVVKNDRGDDQRQTLDYIEVTDPPRGKPGPYAQGFETEDNVRQDLRIDNPDSNTTWRIDSVAARQGMYSFVMENWESDVGQRDDFELPLLNISQLGANVYLEFDWAYASADTLQTDELSVMISRDCGFSYDTLLLAFDDELATAAARAAYFVPESHDWRSRRLALDDYRDAEHIRILFRNVTYGGNNLYIDNIHIGGRATDIAVETRRSMAPRVFPNPFQVTTTIEYSLAREQVVTMVFYNIAGKVLHREERGLQAAGIHQLQLDAEAVSFIPPNGLMVLHLELGGQNFIKKLVVRR